MNVVRGEALERRRRRKIRNDECSMVR